MTTRTEDEVRAEIREIVASLAPVQVAEVTSQMSLVDGLGYQSLALLELAFALEDEFKLPQIEQERAAQIRTVRDIEDYVVEELRAQGAPGSDAR
jgi:acyl carrier protein